jgi:hypothetical protein
MEDRVKCTCDQARREARAEAFEEAAVWHQLIRDRLVDNDTELAWDAHFNSAMHFAEQAAVARQRAPHAPKPPVRYTEAPEPETPPAEADGFTTEHATGWPKRLIPDWPDSYPFEALDPWPGADGGRDGA